MDKQNVYSVLYRLSVTDSREWGRVTVSSLSLLNFSSFSLHSSNYFSNSYAGWIQRERECDRVPNIIGQLLRCSNLREKVWLKRWHEPLPTPTSILPKLQSSSWQILRVVIDLERAAWLCEDEAVLCQLRNRHLIHHTMSSNEAYLSSHPESPVQHLTGITFFDRDEEDYKKTLTLCYPTRLICILVLNPAYIRWSSFHFSLKLGNETNGDCGRGWGVWKQSHY